MADPRTSATTRQRADALYTTLDPVRLLREIRAAQQQLVEIADRPVTGSASPASAPTMAEFLSSLQTAWQQGEVRPTSRVRENAKRGRRRPDPLALVTAQLRTWFEAEPWRTSRELLERLQDEQPAGGLPGVLRTLQRRVKAWRSEKAHEMVFGNVDAADREHQVRQREQGDEAREHFG